MSTNPYKSYQSPSKGDWVVPKEEYNHEPEFRTAGWFTKAECFPGLVLDVQGTKALVLFPTIWNKKPTLATGVNRSCPCISISKDDLLQVGEEYARSQVTQSYYDDLWDHFENRDAWPKSHYLPLWLSKEFQAAVEKPQKKKEGLKDPVDRLEEKLPSAPPEHARYQTLEDIQDKVINVGDYVKLFGEWFEVRPTYLKPRRLGMSINHFSFLLAMSLRLSRDEASVAMKNITGYALQEAKVGTPTHWTPTLDCKKLIFFSMALWEADTLAIRIAPFKSGDKVLWRGTGDSSNPIGNQLLTVDEVSTTYLSFKELRSSCILKKEHFFHYVPNKAAYTILANRSKLSSNQQTDNNGRLQDNSSQELPGRQDSQAGGRPGQTLATQIGSQHSGYRRRAAGSKRQTGSSDVSGDCLSGKLRQLRRQYGTGNSDGHGNSRKLRSRPQTAEGNQGQAVLDTAFWRQPGFWRDFGAVNEMRGECRKCGEEDSVFVLEEHTVHHSGTYQCANCHDLFSAP